MCKVYIDPKLDLATIAIDIMGEWEEAENNLLHAIGHFDML